MATSPTVHIIDDDDAVRDSVAVLLETHGLSCVTYGSVQAFLAHSGAAAGDCVITDMLMPGMNGLALLKVVQDWPVAPPVILIAGRGDGALFREAKALGAFAVLDKPFAAEALLEAVRAALAGGAGA